MKLLFWNLYKKENSKHISALLASKQIDVAIFAEYKKLDFDKVALISHECEFEYGLGGNDKIILLKKKNISANVKREQSRYTLYSIDVKGTKVNLVGVHLQANPYATSMDRAFTLSELTRDVKELEKETCTDNTIIIGDFNANPFSVELVGKMGLNAVLFKDLIDNKEFVIHDGKQYRRFYNPTLMMLSEKKKQYGSYYYRSGAETLYWNMYDQIVVRKQLMNSIVNMEYCKCAGDNRLTTNYGLPKEDISDHLPLYVEVMI